MQQKNNYFQPGSIPGTAVAYLLLAIAGLSFCFFLGFPFDNHNESYLWVIALQKASLKDVVTKKLLGGIETFRPLGMANAWLSFRLSGNIYLQQILNWLFAISSFILLFAAIGNKILFSLLSFIICTCFFSGYIYLFHLHGVFYGPFQLYVAWLVYIAGRQRRLSSAMLVLTGIITFVVCMYHTFALLVFCAFLAGYLLQLSKKDKIIEFAKLIVIIILTLLLAKWMLTSKELKSIQALTNGLLVSFRLAEINQKFGWIAAALVLLTIVPSIKSTAYKAAAAFLIVLLSVLLMRASIPVLMLWVAACIVKTMSEKKWVMAALIAAAAILPLGSSSGSPTYIIFVLMICAFVTADDARLYINDSVFLRRISFSVVLLAVICLFTLKAGFQVPVAAAAVKPVLAEQEKTKQLKDILTWKATNKVYASFGLSLYDSPDLPVNSKNAVSRANRPSTNQDGINAYLDFLSGTLNEKKDTSLYITFGNEILKDKQLVFFVDGLWNGKACVFK
jgi:hypothetical protein